MNVDRKKLLAGDSEEWARVFTGKPFDRKNSEAVWMAVGWRVPCISGRVDIDRAKLKLSLLQHSPTYKPEWLGTYREFVTTFCNHSPCADKDDSTIEDLVSSVKEAAQRLTNQSGSIRRLQEQLAAARDELKALQATWDAEPPVRDTSIIAYQCAKALAAADSQYQYLIDNNCIEDTPSAITDWAAKRESAVNAVNLKLEEQNRDAYDWRLHKDRIQQLGSIFGPQTDSHS